MKNPLISSLSVCLVAAGCLVQAQTTNHQVLMPSATENSNFSQVTLPMYKGIANGKNVWYVVTESSNKRDATTRGVNFAPKLLNAKGTNAVQKGSFSDGILRVEAGVDFSPNRLVIPGSSVIPPEEYSAGSVAQTGYSPLVELPDGIVLNASQIANFSGRHDRVIKFNFVKNLVTLATSQGFFQGKKVWYTSLEASNELPAALEAATLTPKLNAAPGLGSNQANSSRSGIAIFVNGQTGKDNPNRQGLLSALYGEGAPNNVLQAIPDNTNNTNPYSPLWDARMSVWSQQAVSSGANKLQKDFEQLSSLASNSTIMASDGSKWTATGFVINCPVVSISHL